MSTDLTSTWTNDEGRPLDLNPDSDQTDSTGAEESSKVETGTTEEAGPLSSVEQQLETSEAPSVEPPPSDEQTQTADVDAGVETGPEDATITFKPRGRGDKPVVGKPSGRPTRPRPY